MECKHKNQELRHHQTKDNYPFCMAYWYCNNCDKFLKLEGFALQHKLSHG